MNINARPLLMSCRELMLLLVLSSTCLAGSAAAADPQKPASAAEIRQALQQTARSMNETLPRMLDADTRLESTVAAGREFRYNYTLVNYRAAEVDGAVIQQKMRDKLRSNVCDDARMRVFVANKIPVSYAYHGNDGKEITRIRIDTATC